MILSVYRHRRRCAPFVNWLINTLHNEYTYIHTPTLPVIAFAVKVASTRDSVTFISIKYTAKGTFAHTQTHSLTETLDPRLFKHTHTSNYFFGRPSSTALHSSFELTNNIMQQWSYHFNLIAFTWHIQVRCLPLKSMAQCTLELQPKQWHMATATECSTQTHKGHERREK